MGDIRSMEKTQSSCINYIGREDEQYPKRLKYHKGMPKGLYVFGKLPDDKQKSVAIVGARRSTAYGNAMAKYFARELAKAGVQIISGMAWGIDTCAHEGAFEGGGKTFAVLGCGVDVCYPASNRRLYERMKVEGGILSEQAFGMPPLPQHFPARNRIISGLADLVLVVEAKEKSGSLITADFALEQGKDVFAIPGRIGDELSAGCLNLLKQGAGIADHPNRILEILEISDKIRQEKAHKIEKDIKILLANDENIVYSLICLQPTSLEELVKQTKFSVSELLSILVVLQLKGCIKEVQKNYYIRTDLRMNDGKIFGNSRITSKGEND